MEQKRSSKSRHKQGGMRLSGTGSIIVPKNTGDNIEVMMVNKKEEQPVVSSRIKVRQEMPFETAWAFSNPESEQFLKTEHYVNLVATHQLPPLPYCVVCHTEDHSIEYCMQAPPHKIKRINELGLCNKCLETGHTANECTHNISCETCGDRHYDFIFHKPYGWVYNVRTPDLKAIAAPPATNGANYHKHILQIENGPQDVQPKKEEQALLPIQMVDPGDSTTKSTPDPKQPLINFYEGENIFDL